MPLGRVVWEGTLRGTTVMVPDRGRKSAFRLTAFLNFKFGLLFCSQEAQTSRSGDQLVVLWVGAVCPDRVAQTVAQKNVARVER